MLDRGIEFDDKGNPFKVIRKVRWTNIGLSQTPVNLHVPEASTMPIGVLAKALGVVCKGLEAGYGTDSATLSGGGALRRQSLDRTVQDGTVRNYFDFRDRMAGHLRKHIAALGDHEGQLRHATDSFGIEPVIAAEWLERMHGDMGRKPQRTGHG